MYGHGIPVPKMLLLEEDPAQLGGAISLAEDLRGYHNSEYQIQGPEWRDRLPRLAQGMWTAMGRLAALPVENLDLAFMKPSTRETTAMQELDYWEATLDKADLGAEPITRAAIRWMRRPFASTRTGASPRASVAVVTLPGISRCATPTCSRRSRR